MCYEVVWVLYMKYIFILLYYKFILIKKICEICNICMYLFCVKKKIKNKK